MTVIGGLLFFYSSLAQKSLGNVAEIQYFSVSFPKDFFKKLP